MHETLRDKLASFALCACNHTRGRGGSLDATGMCSIQLAGNPRSGALQNQMWALCPECTGKVEQFFAELGGEVRAEQPS
jgi:hypothetical protein